MAECNLTNTPMEPQLKLNKDGCDIILELNWKLKISTSYTTRHDLLGEHIE